MRFSHRFGPKRRTKKKGPKYAHAGNRLPQVEPKPAPLDLPPDKTDAPPQAYRDRQRGNARTLADAELGPHPVIRRSLLESLTLEQAKRASHSDRISEPEWVWYAILWRNAAPRYAPEMDQWLR